MKCIHCRKDLEPTTERVTDMFEGHLLVVDEIPAFECLSCGETVFWGDAAKRIHEIFSAMKEDIKRRAPIHHTNDPPILEYKRYNAT